MPASHLFRPRLLTGLLLLVATVATAPAAQPDTASTELVARYGMLGILDSEPADPLAGLEIRLPQHWHGIHPYVSFNLTDDQIWFFGAGLIKHFTLSPLYRLTIGTGPFYYRNEPRRDLGLDLEFYSFAELTRELPRDQRLGLRIGHLSNAGLGRRNPGSETISLIYTRPLEKLTRLFAGPMSQPTPTYSSH